MTQFDTSSVVLREPPNRGISNGREIGAFVVAELVKLVGTYSLSFLGLLSPLYMWAFHAGGGAAIFMVSIGFSIFWGIVVLLVFLLLRAPFGGVPAIVAPPGRESAVTTRGGEIGAFVLAYGGVIALVLALNALVLAPLYVALGRQLVPALGLAVSIVSAAVVYAAFIGLRQAFLPAPSK